MISAPSTLISVTYIPERIGSGSFGVTEYFPSRVMSTVVLLSPFGSTTVISTGTFDLKLSIWPSITGITKFDLTGFCNASEAEEYHCMISLDLSKFVS